MKEITEVVFVLDMSGSMHHLTDDTIGGFNSFIEKQKDPDRETLVTTVLFNTETRILHDRVSIEKIEPMTRRDYRPDGGTALLDAVGETVDRVELIQDHLRAEDVPKHTVLAITTDGEENSSTKYDYETIKKMLDRVQNEKGWEVVFLGANIDAERFGRSIGLARRRCVSMNKDFRMSNVFSAMNDMICDIDLGVGFEEKSMSDYYHEAVGRNKNKAPTEAEDKDNK